MISNEDSTDSGKVRFASFLADGVDRLLRSGPPELAHFDNHVRIECERIRQCILSGKLGNCEVTLRAAVGDWLNAWREYRQNAKAALRL